MDSSDMFGVENRSVEQFIQELRSESMMELSDVSENSISLDDDKSPTKPLNISKSEISLHTVLEVDLHRADSKLNGPRQLNQTQESPMSKVKQVVVPSTPSPKKVQIDVSPPKVMEYDQMTSEEDTSLNSEHETSDSSAELENVTEWAVAPVRGEAKIRGKPLPPIRPSPSDISIRSMPNMRFQDSIVHLHSPQKVSTQFHSDDSGASEDVSLTADDFLDQQKKIPMDQRLNAMLESPKTKELLSFDNDNYCEDERLGLLRQKSDVRRNKQGREKYLDDVLLHKVKVDEIDEVALEDVGDLYEQDVRNTKGNQLVLHLEKVPSHQSQASMISTERNLETIDEPAVAQPVVFRDGVKGFSDELLQEILPAPQPVADLAKKNQTLENSIKEMLETPKQHERKSSVSSVLSPSKVGQFFLDVGKSVSDKFTSQHEAADESLVSQSEAESDYKSAEEGFTSDEEDGFESAFTKQSTEGVPESDTLQDVHGALEDADKTDTEGNSTEELLVLNKTRELTPASMSEELLANSTELDNNVNENGNENSESTIDLLNEFHLEVPFDDDPYTLPKELEQDADSSLESIKRRRRCTVEFCQEVSPKQEVLSIWQSQKSLRKVSPKQALVQQVPQKPMFPKRRISPRSVNVVTQRVVSQQSNRSLDETVNTTASSITVPAAPAAATRMVSLGQYIDLPKGSDFAEEFRSWLVDESAREDTTVLDVNESAELDAHIKSPHLTEQNGSVARIWRNGTVSVKRQPSYKMRSQKLHAAVAKMMEAKDSELALKSTAPVTLVNDNFQSKSHREKTGELLSLDVAPTPAEASFEIFADASPTPVVKQVAVDTSKKHTSAASRYGGLVPDVRKELRPMMPTNPSRVNSGIQPSKAVVKEVLPEAELEPTPQLISGEQGRLFVRLMGVSNLQIPQLHSRDAEFCMVLDNGIHTIKTKYFKVSDARYIPIEKEFELIVAEKLDFIITFKMRYSKPKPKLVEVRETKTVKSKNKFARLFGAKDLVTTTTYVNKPADADPWDKLFANDGSFARASMSFDDHKDRIRCRIHQLMVPLTNEWMMNGSVRAAPYTIGQLDVKLFFIPRTVEHEMIPSSIKMAFEEMEEAKKQSLVTHEGFMFQEGGDSPYWKRRYFKLHGTDLVAHHETTLKPKARINLKKVVQVDYFGKEEGLNPPVLEFQPPKMGSVSSRNFSDTLLVNDGFRLKFLNGESIDFGAETKEEKQVWINLVEEVIGRNNFAKQPWIQLMLANN